MKTNIFISSLLLVAGLFSSCQSEMDEAKGYGYLQLSAVDIDKNVESRADVTASENIAVDVFQSEMIVRHADDWKELNDVLLPVGTYTIKAYSAGKDKEVQGFDAQPYYEGQEDVAIEANKAKAVEITCRLAQAMVSVSASETFNTTFTEYSCYVDGTEELSIPFVKDETRKAYVKAGQALTLRVDFGNGNIFSQEITNSTNAAYYYKVNLDITEGNAGIDISVDQTVHQYEVTVKVPTKQESTDIVTTDIRNDVSKVWGQFAYLSGVCNMEEVTSPVQFRYKKTSDSEWTTVEAVQEEGTNKYTAKVSPLDFSTEYEYYILSGDKTGATCSFVTESFVEIPNLNFNTWTKTEEGLFTKRDCWFPNADQANSFWATGNKGVVTLKSSNSIPVEDGRDGYSVKLTTISISMVGYAAGNLFIGEYNTNMSDPGSSVSFGRAYSGARPVKLSGWYKYAPGATMRTGATVPADRTLATDECEIYIKLWSGDVLVGSGSFVDNKNVAEYTKFECPINYVDETKRPDKITIVATSSRYGGEFEGTSVVGQLAENSTLWVDDFELSYY